MSITVVLAEDHTIVRQGVKALLDAQADIEVIGETGGALEAIKLVENLHPQIAVVDLMMPGMNGLELTRRISPRCKVIVLSMHANEAYVIESLHNGAFGYVLKDASSEDLVKAIYLAQEGHRFLSAPFSDKAIDLYLNRGQDLPEEPFDSLTRREREVLQLVSEGYSNHEIGARFKISTRTVEAHRANMMAKLKIHNQAELVRIALKKGLTS